MIRYSEKINGDSGNYDWKVSFDITSGYVGINQFHEGNKIERVLLSKAQMKALLKFGGLTKRATDVASRRVVKAKSRNASCG